MADMMQCRSDGMFGSLVDGANTPNGVPAPFFCLCGGSMREALTRLIKRRTRPAAVAPDFDQLWPFPLSRPADEDGSQKPSHSATEGAFYEGSVMIW